MALAFCSAADFASLAVVCAALASFTPLFA